MSGFPGLGVEDGIGVVAAGSAAHFFGRYSNEQHGDEASPRHDPGRKLTLSPRAPKRGTTA
jgi:hypothetical protein